MTALTADDAQLVARLRHGDAGAARELYERHGGALLRFAMAMSNCHQTAEDVVHDTFVVALEDIEAFDGRAGLQTWLQGIARNKIRAERRKRAPVALDVALLEAQGEIDAILCDVAREPLPDEVLERAETRDLVGATLSALPDDYRRALIEKYVDGLSVEAIAGRAKKSPKATESTLTRARAAFARVFELLAKKRGGLE